MVLSNSISPRTKENMENSKLNNIETLPIKNIRYSCSQNAHILSTNLSSNQKLKNGNNCEGFVNNVTQIN